MCGRYVLERQAKELAQHYNAQVTQTEFRTSFNVAPTAIMPVVVAHDDDRFIEAMRWGIVPRWKRDGSAPPPLINARAETVAEKPTFRKLLQGRRCLVPANGFYEWEKSPGGKIPHFFTVPDQEVISYAGLYDDSQEDETGAAYTILTTAANELVAPFHDRMPVILRPEDEELWLDEGITEPAALEPLYVPFPADRMAQWAVSRRVNNARLDDPELIAPLQ